MRKAGDFPGFFRKNIKKSKKIIVDIKKSIIFASELIIKAARRIPGNDKKVKIMKANYEISPVTDSRDFVIYYQIVRRKDGAILYANEELNNCILQAWALGLNYHDVVVC